MKTILVPTDYSETSRNAAIYALNLAAQTNVQQIILYNAYQSPPVITETGVVPTSAMPFMDLETIREISSKGMQHFMQSIESFCPPGVEIKQQTEYANLDNDINEVCKKTGAELIVLGITGTSKIEEVLIGSTAINVVRTTKVPVIIVPAQAKYTSVKNIMLACDYKKVVETTPVRLIRNILDATNATLHVVNVYKGEKEISSDKTYQRELLHSILKEYNPQFHFEYNENFISGINDFAETHNIDLIITIPKKHRFFDGLFKERHTKKLAFHSHIPLMYIHEEDL